MEERKFVIRRAGRSDLSGIMELMEETKAGMAHPEWYVTDSEERVERHLDRQGFILVAECESRLAGFFMVDIPARQPDGSEDELDENLGETLRLDEEQLKLVAHMDSAAVRPEFRGYHLQSRLLEAAEQQLAALPYRYYLCTVHPANHASLHTMQRHGYVIVATKEKYGGLTRHILYKKKEQKPAILVSACLLGVCCRYHGGGEVSAPVLALRNEAQLIPFCPEITGGLPTPREPAERLNGRVVTRGGTDVTEQYRRGAEEALRLAQLMGCRAAVLKERSPSCGSGTIYDGSHTGTLIPGDGMTAELLKKHGIAVFGESRAEECLLSRGLS